MSARDELAEIIAGVILDERGVKIGVLADAILAAGYQKPRTIIHLSDPACGSSFCGEPVTIIEESGDTRPVCQACHRGAMKSLRSGWCPCSSNRPQDCKPELWPLSARHGIKRETPRTITSAEELKALPVGSIIHMADIKAPFLLTDQGWESTRVPGKTVYDYVLAQHYLPATVLWEPK